MLYPIANLENDKLEAVKKLENEIGSTVIALSTIKADSAKLPDEKLKKLQDLEDELDVVLVALSA